ncbi:MAG: glycosyltransferase [Kiritimatiellia bacterium]
MQRMIVHICMIADDNYVMPTSVAMTSFINHKDSSETYHFHIVAAALSAETQAVFKSFARPDVIVDILEQDPAVFAGAHKFDPHAVCVASVSALFKFMLADLLPDLDKVLYMDGDIVARHSLGEIYKVGLGDNYAAVVADSGQIYYKHDYVKRVRRYFNSGVMLLNLKRMRQDDMSRVLLDCKRAQQDSNLMDQNVFNVVFDGHVKYLPIRYNFQGVSLIRAEGKWTLAQLNTLFGTNYATERDLFADAAVIHYSSKDKPWKTPDGVLTYEWLRDYAQAPISHPLLPQTAIDGKAPLVSVVMPCYNVEHYVGETLDSLLKQTYRPIEIICLDDGSTDKTAEVLKRYAESNDNISVTLNSNHHQGWERNEGMKLAKGKYLYFMDSDDILAPKAIAELVLFAEQNETDIIYFEADSFYETDKLKKKFPAYKSLYHRKCAFPALYKGEELYFRQRTRGGMIISPCLQFLRKDFVDEAKLSFPELPTWEDNIFAIDALLAAKRVLALPARYYRRRVRSGSTMTATDAVERSLAIGVIAGHILKRSEGYLEESQERELLRAHALGYLRRFQESLTAAPAERTSLDSALNSALKASDLVPLTLRYFDTLSYVRRRFNEVDTALKKLEEKMRMRAGANAGGIVSPKWRMAELRLIVQRAASQIGHKTREKVWGGVKCLRENGVKYTAKHAAGKVLRRIGLEGVKW